MPSTSSPVHSAQTGIHPRLEAMLRRHFDNEWQQPEHAPSTGMFAKLVELRRGDARPLLIDSGCGNGDSTLLLAAAHPSHTVLGIDQSAARLSRHAPAGIAVQANAILLRAELASFWRLFVAAGWRAERHYLLYPNPWPKAAHLGRRWQGHPVFPTLMRTAQAFELRSNWRVYADEFAFALRFARGGDVAAAEFHCTAPLTPFERKYRDSGHALWRVVSERGMPL